MSDNDEVTPGPVVLAAEDVRRLTGGDIDATSRARIALGLSGLTAAEVHALDMRHVTLDGRDALSIILVPTVDARRVDFGPPRRLALAHDVRFVVGCHVTSRRNRCAHHALLMQTWKDSRGITRCASCDEAIDFLSLALFDSRESDRMSVSAIREDFRRVRDQLGLDRSLTFDSLRDFYRPLGGPGKRPA